MNKRRVILYLFLTVVSLLLALESERERFVAQAVSDELAGALSNVVGQVREADRNFKIASDHISADSLAKARAWALLVEADTSCLTNQDRLVRVCKLLDADEVTVSDENGILIAGEPKMLCGYDFASSEQSAAFLPAITNSNFEFVQEPLPRGIDGGLFQYVGVARRDQPGLVQVGVSRIGIGQKRTDRLRSLVSIDQIVRTSRVRRGGYVKIEDKNTPIENDDGRLWVKRQDVGDWRVTVAGPVPSDVNSGRIVSVIFGIAAFVFVLLFLRAVVVGSSGTTVSKRRVCAFAGFGILALIFAFQSCRATAEVATVREKLLLSLESATSRVRSASERAKTITELTTDSNLAKKHVYDILVKTDPSILNDKDRLSYAHRAFDEEDVSQMQVLAGYEDACRSVRESDGRFTDVVPAPASTAECPKGYFTEIRNGQSCLCLASKCEDRLVTVGVPTPERFMSYPAVCASFFIIAVLLFIGVLCALAPEAAVVALSCIKTTLAYFWGLRSSTNGLVERSRFSFKDTMSNPIVIACLLGFTLCCGGTLALRTHEAWKNAKKELATTASAVVDDVSGSVDNMLFAISHAIVRHYRKPDVFTPKDAADLADRYDIDEVSIINSNGIAFVTNFGFEMFDMGSMTESAKFNCLLNGATSFTSPFRAAVDDPNVVRKYVGVPFPDAPGYVQIGIDRMRLLNELKYIFNDNVGSRVVGERGFLLWVVNETGEILANGAPDASVNDTLANIGFNTATAPEAGVPFMADFYGHECLVVWKPYANLRLYAVLPCNEVSGMKGAFMPFAMLVLVFGCFLVLALRLADLVSQLKSFIVAEHERQKSDMTMARTIQTSALPVGFPSDCDFSIFAKMMTAREVGGDFYDFYALPDGRIAFLVADVSGKGVPAALFMMRAKATVRSAIVENEGDLAEAVRRANDNLSENNDAEMFVTAWVAVYDRKTGDVEYVSAGHNPPIVKRADGSIEWVRERGGLALAAMSDVPYRSHRLHLAPGDSIFLYTDGVTEAINTACEQYGEQRLEATIRRAGREFVTEIGKDLSVFTAGAEQFDDITMLAFDVLPK